MSAKEKAELYGLLKRYGTVEKHYRDYTSEELRSLLTELDVDIEAGLEEVRALDAEPAPPEGQQKKFSGEVPLEVLRVDEQGRQWYQEEVRKPAYPKPRGRRVLTYLESGVEKQTVRNGDYVETFEVAGNLPTRPAEVKITLPSYQVGVYKDPRFPFKIHCYDGREGFDLFDVQNFYGGAELVPPVVKRVYIENVLCYDIRTVIRAINDEHRHLQLTGRITR